MAETSTITITPRDDLLKSLEKHNSTFTTLLSLIPTQYYIAPDPEVADSKWMKNKKRKTGEEIKEHKRKVKQDKLDPLNNSKTLDQIQSTSNDNTDQTESAEIKDILPEAGPSNLRPLPPQASITDLRAKLQNRLDSFKRQRGVNVDEEGSTSSRNELEEERRRKRGEMRDKRRNSRKEERRKEGERGNIAKTQLIVPQLPREDPTSSLSFPSVSLPSSSKPKPNGKGFKKITDPSQALAHLEKHKEHLESLPEEKRKEIQEREKWLKAEERASGVKITDSEQTLKKAVKRKEKAKSKSSQAWAERKRDIEKSAATAAKKRNDNIAKRVDDKRNKRLGIKDKGAASKKGKSRPGFEGKKGKGGGGKK